MNVARTRASVKLDTLEMDLVVITSIQVRCTGKQLEIHCYGPLCPKKVSCLMSLVYALRHQRILCSSDVSCCCVNGLRLLYTLTCKHVIAIKKYVFKGAIILIPLLRPGVFSNISKRWRLP